MSLDAYLTVAAADLLAADVPPLVAWGAADAGAKGRALAQASDDVDHAMPYQGRRCEPSQAREFPRIAYDATAGGDAAVTWDVDPASAAPVVPRAVRLATLLQADAILAAAREDRVAAQHDGVVYQLTGTTAESYKRNTGPGVTTGLCRRAWVLVRRYRLRSGKLV